LVPEKAEKVSEPATEEKRPEPAKAAEAPPERPMAGDAPSGTTEGAAPGSAPQKPAQQSATVQHPPPPDHPSQQQQQYYQQPNQAWQTHQTAQGSGNQCPRCYKTNVVYYYHDGSAYCSVCNYRFYWKKPENFLDSMTRKLDGVLK
jgi:hypothetical protein